MNGWSSGSNYSSKDLMRMQQEAVERVREMQERSRKALENSGGYTEPPASNRQESPPHRENNNSGGGPNFPTFARSPERPGHPEQRYSVPQEKPVIQIPQSRANPSGGLFSGGGPLGSLGSTIGSIFSGGENGPISRVMDALGIDNDKILILILLFILLNNQADKKLILALCYILL